LCAASLQAGEVERASQSCQQSLEIRRALQDKGDVAKSLTNSGDVQRARGDLAAAKQSYDKALPILNELNQKSDAAYLQISMATLALDENRVADAKKLAETAMAELVAEKDPDGEGTCRAILAQVSLLQGDRPGAVTQSQEAQKLALKAGDKIVELEARITETKAALPTSSLAASEARLKAIEQEAKKGGFAQVAFEARLALGEVQSKSGKTISSKATLQALAQEAKAKGFGLIAQKAENGK
jgi:ATP/maltotriose-dependent transcriptional regulator MalT